MQKVIYCSAITLLLVIVVAGFWFLPIGRDLDADKEYLHQPIVPTSK